MPVVNCFFTGYSTYNMDITKHETTIKFKRQGSSKKKYIEIISLVKEMILKGQIRPGDRLPTEAQLTEQLGISRTSVREALKILESMGVIIIKRGEGMFLQRPLAGTEMNPLIFDLLMMSNEPNALLSFDSILNIWSLKWLRQMGRHRTAKS